MGVGPFKIVRRLASGDTGSTFLAGTPWPAMPVATVKCLSAGVGLGAGLTESLRHHGQEVMSLAHPSLVPILDVGGGQRLLYYAWAHVPGRDVVSVARRQNQRGLSAPVAVGVAVLLDGLLGLEYLSSQRQPLRSPLLARWLEPEHLILGYDGALRLAFAGVATPGSAPRVARSSYELVTLGWAVHALLSSGLPGARRTTREPLSALRGDVPRWLSDLVQEMLRSPAHPEPSAAHRLRERTRRSALVSGHLGAHKLVGQYVRALFAAEQARERAELEALSGDTSLDHFIGEEETALELAEVLVADLASSSPAAELSLPTIVAPTMPSLRDQTFVNPGRRPSRPSAGR